MSKIKSADAPKVFRDESRQTVFRHWTCAEAGCDGEMKSVGHSISNNAGSNWLHSCDKCEREAWASAPYPRIAHKSTA